MTFLLKKLMLSDKGMMDMKKSTIYTILKKLSCLFPFVIITLLMRELLLNQGSLNERHMVIYMITGLIGFILVLFSVKTAFRKNFIPAYQEIEGIRMRLADHIPDLSFRYLNHMQTTDLIGAISSDCVTMETVICTLFPELTGNLVFVTASLIILAIIDIRLALVTLITIPPAFLVEFGSLNLQKKLTKNQILAKQKVTMETEQYIEGIRIIKAYRLGAQQGGKLGEALREMQQASMRLELISGIFIAGAEVLLNFGIGLVVWTGAWLFTKDLVSFLTILIFSMSVLCIYDPMTETIELISGLTYMREAVERIKDILEEEKKQGEELFHPINFDIRFEDVTFSYQEGDRPVLDHVDLTMKEGEITALVGPSGCGKTTLARLALGFWNPDTGKVSVGGCNLKDAEAFSVTSYFSTVFQDVVLFHDTIANNIRIGNESASDEEVLRAAEEACCMEFIEKYEDGIHTVISENGASLSGGERQRISIARAILKDAPILILDEATASLDPENEEMVQKALSSLTAKGKTVLVIAHRLRTIVDADQIVVMDEGKIIARGKHEELMNTNQLYINMTMLQEKY